jgi:hypothetical protein
VVIQFGGVWVAVGYLCGEFAHKLRPRTLVISVLLDDTRANIRSGPRSEVVPHLEHGPDLSPVPNESPEVGADIPTINCDVRWTESWTQEARVGILRSVTSPLRNDAARYHRTAARPRCSSVYCRGQLEDDWSFHHEGTPPVDRDMITLTNILP